ncbi:hypothetical protein STTU_6442 [Streptomyces sp. Tu6071]|nr:hypothetical protein STTU_6442 [Streptomyces sp. Tu6071]
MPVTAPQGGRVPCRRGGRLTRRRLLFLRHTARETCAGEAGD